MPDKTKTGDAFAVPAQCAKTWQSFGDIIPQGTDVEEAAPPTYWGTFAAGTYRIDYVGGARFQPDNHSCWFLDFAPGSAGNYELFYSGGEQDQHYPPGTYGCFESSLAVVAANTGASFVFSHTGGQIGMALDFKAVNDGSLPLPTFRLLGLLCGIIGDAFASPFSLRNLSGDCIAVTGIGMGVQVTGNAVAVHPEVLNPNAIIPKGLCREQLCCK